MTNPEFYARIIKDNLYSVFNGIRDGLFDELATRNRNPICHSELENILSKGGHFHKTQEDLIRSEIPDGVSFRHYECFFDGLKLHYFVSLMDDIDINAPIASHLQESYLSPDEKVSATSVVILKEKHPKLERVRYPKIIKHELSHASIEYSIHGDPKLEEFYYNEKNSEFIEFLCDILPYMSSPSKKENGLSKFMDDSIVYFGYDAEETKANFIKDINEASSIDLPIVDMD